MTSNRQARLGSHSLLRLRFHLLGRLPRRLHDNLLWRHRFLPPPLVNPPRCRQQPAQPRQRRSKSSVPQPQLSPRLRQPPSLFPRVQLPRPHSALLASFPCQQFAPSPCSRLLASLFPRLPVPSRLPLPPLDNPLRRRQQPSPQQQRSSSRPRRPRAPSLFLSLQLPRRLPLRPPLVNPPPHRRKPAQPRQRRRS